MSILLMVHIAGGFVALSSGVAAMIFRKGSKLHKKNGNVFVISMLVMAITASYLAWNKAIMLSVFGGTLTTYLVITAWLAARRKKGQSGIAEVSALLLILVTAVGYYYFGFETLNSASGLSKDGLPAQAFFVFGSVAIIAAFFDIKMLLAKKLNQAQRMTRHIWRSGFAMFMATVSLFLGQSQVFPESLQKIEFLAPPVIAVIAFLLYWLCRVLFTNLYKKPKIAVN